MAGREILIAALMLAPGVGTACTPGLVEVTGAWTERGGCARSLALDEYRTVGLGPAEDLGNGLVSQRWFDGNACYWRAGMIVMDCRSGRAIAIGPDQLSLMEGPKTTGIDRIVERVVAAPATLEQLVAMARAEGYDAPGRLAPGGAMYIDATPVAIGCGCTTFYPETAGETN